MTDAPISFEQQIHRIVAFIEETGAQVTWNDRISDPADGESRQIDITIRKDGRLTIIECRNHKRRQDKMWVEGLYGRMVSLGAGAVVGVSSSGFTRGALQTANRLGVLLRQLDSVSIQEARSWPNLSKVSATFVQFQNILFKIRVRGRHISKGQPILRNEKGEIAHLHDFARQLTGKLHEKLSATNDPHLWQKFQSSPFGKKGLFLDDMPVVSMVTDCTARLVTKTQVLSAVYDYGHPPPNTCSEATVEKTENGVSEWIKSGNRAEWHLDLSSLVTPENSVLITIGTDHGKPMTINRYSFRHGKDFRYSTLDEIDLEIHSD